MLGDRFGVEVTSGPAMNAFRERGGFWVLGQATLMVAVVVSALVWRSAPGRFILYLGVAAMTLGGIIAILGFIALGRNLTPFPKPGPEARLNQQGIYGLLRHPLYGSVILAGVGWAMFRGSVPALVLSAALAVFLNAKVIREERWLRERFPEYDGYARRVRRLIPWIY